MNSKFHTDQEVMCLYPYGSGEAETKINPEADGFETVSLWVGRIKSIDDDILTVFIPVTDKVIKIHKSRVRTHAE